MLIRLLIRIDLLTLILIKEKIMKTIKQASSKKFTLEQTFDEVFSFKNLYQAGKECCKGTRWKTSIIDFETNLFSNVQSIYKQLHSSPYQFECFFSYALFDHGKIRWIDALPIKERCIHKTLCKYCLNNLSKSFINDNGASQLGKGMHFALKRLRKHLTYHFHRYGLEGGIYQFDLKDYFASIPHDKLKERMKHKIKDQKIYDLVCYYIDQFQYMSRNKYKPIKTQGLGLGSEMSQILALEYVNPLDHYVKDTLSIKGYAHYMDAFYIIYHDLKVLKEIQSRVHDFIHSLGLEYSEKKDKITPFKHHSFTFLKISFHFSLTGKIIMKLSKRSSKATRRKLKIFRRWYDKGLFTFQNICESYQSWRAHALHTNSYRIIKNMDEYFKRIYKDLITDKIPSFLR